MKKKLALESLKISSFITNADKIRGGEPVPDTELCLPKTRDTCDDWCKKDDGGGGSIIIKF